MATPIVGGIDFGPRQALQTPDTTPALAALDRAVERGILSGRDAAEKLGGAFAAKRDFERPVNQNIRDIELQQSELLKKQATAANQAFDPNMPIGGMPPDPDTQKLYNAQIAKYGGDFAELRRGGQWLPEEEQARILHEKAQQAKQAEEVKNAPPPPTPEEATAIQAEKETIESAKNVIRLLDEPGLPIAGATPSILLGTGASRAGAAVEGATGLNLGMTDYYQRQTALAQLLKDKVLSKANELGMTVSRDTARILEDATAAVADSPEKVKAELESWIRILEARQAARQSGAPVQPAATPGTAATPATPATQELQFQINPADGVDGRTAAKQAYQAAKTSPDGTIIYVGSLKYVVQDGRLVPAP